MLRLVLLYEDQNLELSHCTCHLVVFLDEGVSGTICISLMVTK